MKKKYEIQDLLDMGWTHKEMIRDNKEQQKRSDGLFDICIVCSFLFLGLGVFLQKLDIIIIFSLPFHIYSILLVTIDIKIKKRIKELLDDLYIKTHYTKKKVK